MRRRHQDFLNPAQFTDGLRVYQITVNLRHRIRKHNVQGMKTQPRQRHEIHIAIQRLEHRRAKTRGQVILQRIVMCAVHRPKQTRTVIHRMLRPVRQILQDNQQRPIQHTLALPIHHPMHKAPAQHRERQAFKQHIQAQIRQGKGRAGQAVLERIQTQTTQIRVRQFQHNHQHKQRHTIRINNLLIQPIRHNTPTTSKPILKKIRKK